MIPLPFTVTVTRRRYPAPTTGTDGRPVRGTPTDSSILASVQPSPGGEQLQHLPEGLRQRISLLAFTESDLRTADHATGTAADELVYEGAVYEVERVHRWTELLPHLEVYLSRRAETGGQP